MRTWVFICVKGGCERRMELLTQGLPCEKGLELLQKENGVADADTVHRKEKHAAVGGEFIRV